MSKEIHAHAILNMLREQSMTEEALREAVMKEYGSDVKFRTCSQNGFDLEALLAFFQQREKVFVADGVWTLNAERVCSH
ncbi:YecH family protein [Vibrio sp. ZSDE26]|uniref:YecH family protein n=1 Tax=Vibrio amylolyticus TaxID=2847292 RepID=A0A9X1XPG1_9VIBR|nr:YecH family metal-binding protein [Vibrio amylolyticus]MCK6265743.1 YecH family protein [Vibrio amylolyticus]